MKRLLASREAILFLLLLVVYLGFAATVDGFSDWNNLLRRARYWVPAGLLALPMTFIMATAGIDLSVGSILALSGVVLGMLFNDAHLPIWLAGAVAVVVGGVCGMANGVVISRLGVPPLVTTLATMALFRGIAMGLSKARALADFPPGFLWVGQGSLLKLSGGMDIPFSIVFLMAAFLLAGLVMRKTWMGRFTECIGENPIAARFAAIGVSRMYLALYTVCGIMCGIAALFHTALYATAKADTARGLELEVVACVVIGGTRISGGQGSIVGSLLGLFLIGILRHGLLLADVRAQYVIIAVGVLLVITAILNEWMTSRGRAKS